MKLRKVFGTLALAVVLLAPAQSVDQANSDPWIPIGRSIQYQEFTLPGPVRAFVTRMSRADPTVTLEASLAMGQLGAGLETVRSQAARYDDTINFWPNLDDPERMGSWGKVSNVVVAINGSYFGNDGSLPENGLVQAGWYAKRYTDELGISGFVWKPGEAFVGGCVMQPPGEQLIILADGGTMQIVGVNIERPDGYAGPIVYTTHFGARTPERADVTEVIVDVPQPVMIGDGDKATSGTVTEVHRGQGGTPLSFDQVVIAAERGDGDELLAKAAAGTPLSISQKIAHYTNCQPAEGELASFSGAYTSIGGAHVFLQNGEIIQPRKDADRTARHPRTAIAMNDEFIFFIVVDGRDPYWSIGMRFDELGTFARDQLGATWAVAEDGGGSSTMVVHGVVVNNPSDVCSDSGPLRRVYLPQIGPNPANPPQIPPVIQRQYPASHMDINRCERGVANGIMMVEVQPMAISTRHSAGTQLTTQEDVNLRVGPGTNYASLGLIPEGTPVTIVSEPNGLNGVFATGYHWWRVNVNGTPGWMVEKYLQQP